MEAVCEGEVDWFWPAQGIVFRKQQCIEVTSIVNVASAGVPFAGRGGVSLFYCPDRNRGDTVVEEQNRLDIGTS